MPGGLHYHLEGSNVYKTDYVVLFILSLFLKNLKMIFFSQSS